MYLRHKEDARNVVKARLSYYNAHYGFSFGRVAIRDQRSRWGSCSSRGNLNFNYRVLFLPEHLLDLVIVHELCHLREMNHSADFWALVAQTIPDHKERRRLLSKIPARSLTPSSFLL
jgi:predicted metal-dependent hydrolase